MSDDVLPVTVLYTMPRSVYLGREGVDCWDEVRDARKWPGRTPVVAHPPCALWSRLKGLAKRPIGEKDLARHAVAMIKLYGGVLEHPQHSSLWQDQDLPMPGRGYSLSFTMAFPQRYFGHCCEKMTWLWVRGVPSQALPEIPLVLGYPRYIIACSQKHSRKMAASRRKRNATPPKLADWLVAVARLVYDGPLYANGPPQG